MKILAVLFLIILNSCITGNIGVKTGIYEIQFGSGGGFTGEVKTYILTADCKLFEEDKELNKIKSKTTLEIFKEAQAINEHSFNEPGNMYSFIEIKTKDKTNRIVWAFGSTKVDKRVTELHKRLMILYKNYE